MRQKEYVDAIRSHDVVFAIGPAGTGKTYLAIACALAALKNGEIERIFISRPVVEAGENLGFLPGDMQEKIEPYLRPIFDAFRDMIGQERVLKMIESGTLEIAPLAYMRGRTLNGSFAILDEAQNCTIGQMKMFLTRLGESSKAIVTGDVTQIDLADPAAVGARRGARDPRRRRGDRLRDVRRGGCRAALARQADHPGVQREERAARGEGGARPRGAGNRGGATAGRSERRRRRSND